MITNRFDDFLLIDGVDLSHLMFNVRIGQTVGAIENTAGTETSVSRFPTVYDYSLSLSIGCEEGNQDLILPLIKAGVHVVTYGKQGQAAGKPKHQQEFIFEDVQETGAVDRPKRYFQISGRGSKPPVYNMFEGDVF